MEILMLKVLPKVGPVNVDWSDLQHVKSHASIYFELPI